jgi:hypothetical protein
MNLVGFWERFAPIVVVLPILILAIFYLKNRFFKGSKPPSRKMIHIRIGDDTTLFLKRKKFWGKWYYAIEANKFPVVWKSPEEEYDELNKDMKAPEEQWLKNLDKLTKPGGPMGQTVKEAYSQPEEVAQRKFINRIFRKTKEKI